jgi:hypothetical protein
MKITALLFFILGISFHSIAQSEQLIIKENGKGSYVEHKVTAKENFYSIGRLFNVHPKHIASFNSLDMSKGLSLGQTIKIPLSDTNFNQKSQVGVPVYYVTGNNENLYRVSTNNNNILMEKLKQWNHLTSDKIPSGSKLIVGFVVNPSAQALAVNNTQKPVATTPSNADVNKDEKSETSKQESNKEVVKQNQEEPKKQEERPKEELKKSNDVVQQNQDVKQKKDEPKKNNEVVQVKEEAKPEAQGYFKTSFDQQIKQQPLSKEQTVSSGIFKTTSGLTDAKYYLLMNGVEPGTIVKITNPSNNKVIYAKLLGEISVAQGQGLNIRISNAAATALDISETDKFIVKLNY